jgi:hypothetical protein
MRYARFIGVVSTPLLIGKLTSSTSKPLIVGTGPGQTDATRRTVGDATPTTLVDLNANWVENEHIGKSVVIVSGFGANQKRKIISNTPTSLFLKQPWSSVPNQTSIYQFCYEGYRQLCPNNNVVLSIKEEL